MPAYAAKNFEEEKAAIIRVCASIAPDDPGRAGKVDALSNMLFLEASSEVLNDEEVALACVRVHGVLLLSLSDERKADRRVVLAAASTNGTALEFASEQLRGDKEVVLAAVSNNGSALGDASKELRADKEIVIAAVRNYGCALIHAGETLQGDRGVVLAAVGNDGRALEFASEGLRADKDFVLLAARQAKKLHPRDCHKQAGNALKDVVTEEDFCSAADSAIALPGEDGPVLSVAASPLSQHDGCEGQVTEATFRCDISLMSGCSFECMMQSDDSRALVLNDLAKKLVETLPNHTQEVPATRRVFLNFRAEKEDGDTEFCPVTPWEWGRPLAAFLKAKSRGSDAEDPPPQKLLRT